MIDHLEHRGVLIRDCSLFGETRNDNVFPSHPNGTQVSRNRFLLVYATRSFRGTDDDRSIVFQLRKDSFDGPLLKEGLLAKSLDDWDPLRDGKRYVKQLGSPLVFGVPKGALIAGKPAPTANRFVVKWRCIARYVDPKTGLMLHPSLTDRRLAPATDAVEWTQFRLNDAEDDVEVLQPPQLVRQKGYESGYTFCSAPALFMSQSFVRIRPFSKNHTEWIGYNHFYTSASTHDHWGGIAALRYAFNPRLGLYEWVETGPLIEGDFGEPSVMPWRNGWVICARRYASGIKDRGGPAAWMRTKNPFGEKPRIVYPPRPRSNAPLVAFVYADGVLRLLSGDPNVSPHGNPRDPLYCWDIDPDRKFVASNRRVVFDSVAAGIPMRRQSLVCVDMAKILPHAGGKKQFIVHRVRPTSTFDPKRTGLKVNRKEMAASAIYHAVIHYDQDLPGEWTFGSPSPRRD